MIKKAVKYDTDELPGREKLLEKYADGKSWAGGTRSFKAVPLDILENLVYQGFLDKHSSQNGSPTAKDFMEFMKKYKEHNVKAHGYEVSAKRDDRRVTIEGLELDKPIDSYNDMDFIYEWNDMAEDANDSNDNWIWWD